MKNYDEKILLKCYKDTLYEIEMIHDVECDISDTDDTCYYNQFWKYAILNTLSAHLILFMNIIKIQIQNQK